MIGFIGSVDAEFHSQNPNSDLDWDPIAAMPHNEVGETEDSEMLADQFGNEFDSALLYSASQ